MDQRDAALASLWDRTYRAALVPDPRTLFEEAALDAERQLVRATDPVTDIPAAQALGWFHWLRYLASPSLDATEELSAALGLLLPVFERNPYAVPQPLQQWYLQTEATRRAYSDRTPFADSTGPWTGPWSIEERLPVFHATVRSIIDAAPANQPDRTRFLLGAALMLRRVAGRGMDDAVLAEVAEVTLAALGTARATLPPPTGIHPGAMLPAFLESVSSPPPVAKSLPMSWRQRAALPLYSETRSAIPNAPSAQQTPSPNTGGGVPMAFGYDRSNAPSVGQDATRYANDYVTGGYERARLGLGGDAGHGHVYGGYDHASDEYDGRYNDHVADAGYGTGPGRSRRDRDYDNDGYIGDPYSGDRYSSEEYGSGTYDLPAWANEEHPGRGRGRGKDHQDLGERPGILRFRRHKSEDIWPDDGISDEDYWASVDQPLNPAGSPLGMDPLDATDARMPAESENVAESRPPGGEMRFGDQPGGAGRPRHALGLSGYQSSEYRSAGEYRPEGDASASPDGLVGGGPGIPRRTSGTQGPQVPNIGRPSTGRHSAPHPSTGRPNTGFAAAWQGGAPSNRQASADDQPTSSAFSRSHMADIDGRSYRAAARHSRPQSQSWSRADALIPAQSDVAPPGRPSKPSEPERHLWTQLPERVGVGHRVPLLVWVSMGGGSPTSVRLEPFAVPDDGRRIVVTVSAPGFELLTDADQELLVPGSGDSKPIRFALRAITHGLHHVLVDAFASGTFLGRVRLQVSAEVGAVLTEGAPRQIELPSISGQPGEITLQVNRENGAYSFQLIGASWYQRVLTQSLSADPSEVVERILGELRAIARGESGFTSPRAIRERIRNLGTKLWSDIVPDSVRRQFWEQVGNIRSFVVMSNLDMVPWELLHAVDQGRPEVGFLAEHVPVVRRVYERTPAYKLPFPSSAYVVPPGSPSDALAEVDGVRSVIGHRVQDLGIVSRLDDLHNLFSDPPGLLHFACHNTFSPATGSVVRMDGGPIRPDDLEQCKRRLSMANASPLVFFNACRTAGEIYGFTQMSGWASQFMAAGAGAFIGTLWPVRSATAQMFAMSFYEAIVNQELSLGEASLAARRSVAQDLEDPTWLAYTIYGSPAARLADLKHAERKGLTRMEVNEDGAAVDDVIAAVKDAIKVAGISSSFDNRDLRVVSVRLVLNTIASTTSGGGVDFRIPFLGMRLKVGGSVTTQDTHRLDISLVPPDMSKLHEIRDTDVASALAESVSTIRAIVAKAAGGDDPFALHVALVELSFAITRDGSITLGVNGELHGQVSHTLQMGIEAV